MKRVRHCGLLLFASFLILLIAFACHSSSSSSSSSGADDDSSPADDDASPADDDDDATADCRAYADDAPAPSGSCAGNPNSIFPPPTGPYCIGTTAPIHLVDPSRGEPFTPNDPQARREMMVQVWYPIDQNAAGERAPYMDAKTAAYEAGVIPATWVHMPASAFLALQSHAILNAPPAAGKKKFPILLFSPGLKREYQIYTTMIENVVSHGFIVVSINHPYISGAVVFPDGREVNVSLPADEEGSLDLVVGDAHFTLDNVAKWNVDASDAQPLACRFDLDKAAMYGHSYGGTTAVGLALVDSRIRAALNMDGPALGKAPADGLGQPLFIMLSDEHETDPNLPVEWAQQRGPGFAADIHGTAHMSYSDYPAILHNFAPNTPLSTLDMGTIAPDRAFEIIDRYVPGFFGVYLQAQSLADFLAIAANYSEVTFQSKNVGQ